VTEFRQAADVADGFHAEVIAPLVEETDYAARRTGWSGSIDQFADSTDVLSSPAAFRKLIAVYR
jgi:hypothetical protein